ncbi:DNA polymerase III subunit alpha [Candidatus Riesia pediculicola]|uniref:DNA polymerase III subunit alpha n=1 Tax=Candidatus Riesia pediculicola TaxID=401619 RepID=UPI00178C851A|nr:DNA polymerase III subunit alpha [Candidatus Riesia pediculicola]QOJ86460.1 DNA polymerase III subunit alpha [Candidatus Riesia pediculicola]
MNKEPKFIHLHVRSDYSMSDGLSRIDILIDRALELKMPSIAITDFVNLHGMIKFYELSRSVGIKPIIGSDVIVQDLSKNGFETYYELTILIKDHKGYQNLVQLISLAYRDGNSTMGPIIKKDWLILYREGLILLSGGISGDIGKNILENNLSDLKKNLNFYGTYFHNHYYMEITRTGKIEEEKYIHKVIQLSKKKKIPIVATNNVRFVFKNDFFAHKIRVAIQNGFVLSKSRKDDLRYSDQQYLRSSKEMNDLFRDIPESLKNTVEIAKRCNLQFSFSNFLLPVFPIKNVRIEDFFVFSARSGLEERLKKIYPDPSIRKRKRDKYDQRLSEEINIIHQMGFSGYFLIVMEFVNWSKRKNIPVGPGRGSGAGSLVAYSLKITELDPIKFNLVFERFLNKERISMPDFDIDFCVEKRDLVIEHVIKKYGKDFVSQIIAFGTMTARSVVKDVGRAMCYPYSFTNRISKLIPFDPGMTIEHALSSEKKLKKLYENEEEVKILLDTAKKLEGIVRNVSKHAGGIVISPKKIIKYFPLYYDSIGKNSLTHLDKDDIEKIGLVKFDFLGLKTLTIIRDTIEIINFHSSDLKKITLSDLNSISLNDPMSFDLLRSAETVAIFQLESRGMKDLIRRLQPDCFEDIISLIALFRPGPLKSGMISNFINRKNGLEKISYPEEECQHDLLKSILKNTYGIILYQEQVMQIAQILAGYSLGEADILRRAMSKKNKKEMKDQRKNFERRCLKRGIDREMASRMFDLMEKFSGYGFNKSHSAAYALISYQTLWLKSHYPSEFIAASMTSEMNNLDKIFELVNECRRLKIKILPPNVNQGMYFFQVNRNGEIIYGMGAIKGIGKSVIEKMISSRNKYGKFLDIFDFCRRINVKTVNRKTLEKLILSGSFDCFGQKRFEMLHILKDALKLTAQEKKVQSSGQIDMFETDIRKNRSIREIDDLSRKRLKRMVFYGERNTLGFYLTNHPTSFYRSEISYYTRGKNIRDILSHSFSQESSLTVVGSISSCRLVKCKTSNFFRNSKTIGICTLSDFSGNLEIVLFPEKMERYGSLLKKENILIVTGNIENNEYTHTKRMNVYNLMDLNEAREKYVRCISIMSKEGKIRKHFLKKIQTLLIRYRFGNKPVYFFYKKEDSFIRIKIEKNISITNELIFDLNDIQSDGYRFKLCFKNPARE